MSTEENKALSNRVWDELFNKGNLSVADELFAADYVNHAAPPGTPPGPERVKQIVAMLTSGFPDHQVTVEDIIAEGDKVMSLVTVSGTHQGDFPVFPALQGVTPSGKSFRVSQVHIYRFSGGKIVEHWAVRDDLTMMQQLGLVLLPGGLFS